MLHVGIVFGGRSGEHDVSRCSAASVLQNLDPSKYRAVAIGIDHDGKWYPDDSPVIENDDVFGSILTIKKTGNWFFNVYPENGKLNFFEKESGKTISVDMVFPVIHGTYCEDGKFQGILESANVPYVGADVIGSAIGMDKDVSKRLLEHAGIPVVPWFTAHKSLWDKTAEFTIQEIKMNFGFPCFVKPANAGSSVGIFKVKNSAELSDKVREAFEFDTKVLIEKAVDCREIEFAVLGNDDPRCSAAGEIVPNHEYYSYEAKYVDKNGAVLNIPADLDSEYSDNMRKCALEAYKLLCLKGMCRIDFFIDRNTEDFYLNEVNTLPGFTSVSMYPKLWDYAGLSYSCLLDYLIDLALQGYAEKQTIKYKYDG